ncbi:alpha/beta hydrolase [Paracoccaceae bacterium]|nr:alpha/beta hydrolase [Paracoccaceae bacterium]
MKRIRVQTARGDISTCFWKGPKEGPVLHWAHANGFNGQTYSRILNKLTSKYNIYAWDTPGYGMSETGSYYDAVNPVLGYSKDLAALITELYNKHKSKIVLGGHSIGGSLSIMASKHLNDKVNGLVLADPVVINYYYKYFTKFLGPLGYDSNTVKLYRQALKKRSKWKSFDEVLKSYTNRGIFKTWKEGFLCDYLIGGTKKDKNGVHLSCNPETEAASFINTEKITTPNIVKNINVPTLLLIAEFGSTTASISSFKKLKHLKQVERIRGGSHFFPMEQPDKLISLIKGFKSYS